MRTIKNMFGISSKKLEEKSSKPTILNSSRVKTNGMTATIDGRTIAYRDIVQAVFNEDTTENDGIGGSMFLKTVPSNHNPFRDVELYRFTFDEEGGLKKAKALVKKLEQIGVHTRRLKGSDEQFRELFFVPR